MKLVHKISINAIGIALVFISTCVLNVNIGTSLTNLGDAFIFLFACFFGPISGLVCGSIGSFLADLVVFPVTAFYTLIIKGLEGLIVGLLTNLVYNISETSSNLTREIMKKIFRKLGSMMED